MAREREAHAQGNPDIAIEKQRKIQEETELAHQETEKVSAVWGRLSEGNRQTKRKYVSNSLLSSESGKGRKNVLCTFTSFITMH